MITLKSEFYQSGWENKETKEISIHYGEDFPADWKNYDLKWYNHIVETIEKEQVDFHMPKDPEPSPAPIPDPTDHNTEPPKPLPTIGG